MADASDKLDARPVLSVSKHSPWQYAVEERDRFAGEIRDTLARERVDALVLVSPDGAYPPWVRMESWVPSDVDARSGRRRADLFVAFDSRPYHEYSLVHTVKLTRGEETIAVSERPEFSASDLRDWVRYALGRGSKPANYSPVADALMGFLLAFVPFAHGPHHNPLDRAYRPGFTLGQGLGWGALVLLFLAWMSASNGTIGLAAVLVVLAVALLAAVALMARGRRRLVVVPARPEAAAPPSSLALVDSWHAVASGIGGDYSRIKEQVGAQFDGADRFGIACRWDVSTYRTPNGYDRRERLIVTKGQGVVHVHVYPFGDDLFVGWHAYLNWAKWAETTPIGSKMQSGDLLEFRDLRPGGYIPNQFDLIDLNSMSEFVHRRLERVVKEVLKEKDIDQEIDFEIIRGDRDHALDRKRHEFKETGQGAGGGAWTRIVRSAAAWQPRSETEAVRASGAADRRPAKSTGTLTQPALVMPLLAALIYFGLSYAGVLQNLWFMLGDIYLSYGLNGVPAVVIGLALWRYLGTRLLMAAAAAALVLIFLLAENWAFRAILVHQIQFLIQYLPLVSLGFVDWFIAGLVTVLAIALFVPAFRAPGRILLYGLLSGLCGIAADLTYEMFGVLVYYAAGALPLALIGYWIGRDAKER